MNPYADYGLPAPPEDERYFNPNRFSETTSMPCPDCAAVGKETYMLYDPTEKEWICPECGEEPYADTIEIIAGFFGNLLEIANGNGNTHH